MTATVRTIEPTQITTREEIHWTRTYADYPATLWTLQYRFRGPGIGFNAAATADGDDFDIVVPAATTDNVTEAGWFTWQAWLTEIADSTNKIPIGKGRTRIVVGFDPDHLGAVETRSANEVILDAIKAAISGQASEKVLEYEITTPAGSRKVKRMSMKELLDAQTYYAKLVAGEHSRERIRNGGSLMTGFAVRFYDE